MMNVQGVCKECGNGTLNNELNRAFDIVLGGSLEGDSETPVCARCGSAHVDVLPQYSSCKNC